MRFKKLVLGSSSLIALAFAAPAFAQVTGQEAPAGQTADQAAADQGTPAAPPVATGTQTGTTAGEASPAVTDAAAGEDTIVVTGFRESLASSRNIKRNAPQVIDSVVAEDIGKLPDLSVAETSARIPGVTVERIGGEAARVLVRGLPDFITTYNGREIFTAESRVVALQDFPSSNIAALEVFKTSTANLVEPGLAGLVNVRSRRPFDFRESQISGSVWGIYTKQGDKLAPNFNLLATTRFDTGIGEIGILVNGSVTELQYLDSEPSNTDFIADPTINGRVTRFPDIQRLFYRSGNRIRPSANVAFQWKPSDNIEIYAEGLYQGFRNKIDDRLLEVPLFGGTYSNLVYRDGTNLLRSGTVTNSGGNIFTFQGATYNRTDTYQYAVGGIYTGERLKVSVDLARTTSTFRGQTESVDRFIPGARTVDFNLDVPQVNVRGVDLSNPASFRAAGLYEEQQVATGKDYQARADATYTVSDEGILRTLQLGIRYTDREAFREFANRFGGINAPGESYPLTFAPNNPGFRGTDVQPTRSFITPTYDSIRQNIVQLRQFIITQNPGANFTTTPIVPLRAFTANEETLAGYAQANFGFGDVVDGYVGIRGVRVKNQVVAGVTNIPGFSSGGEVTDWLPNASIRFRIIPELQLRLSYAQTRTRPNFVDLAPGSVGSPQNEVINGQPVTFRSGFSGNPFLQPFNSDNYDASLEYYFSRTGFIAATVFRRDLQGFIQNREFRFTDPVLGNLRITQPQNTGSGKIEGVEVQAQTFFDFEFVPEFLRSFGFQANYTRLDAKTDFFFGGATQPPVRDRILGVSKWTYNLVGLFERGPLSSRLTYLKRGPSRETQLRDGEYFEDRAFPGRLDLSLNLAFHPRATLFADWTNITNKPMTQYLSSARGGAARAEYVRFLRFEETTYAVGLRFRLGGQ